MSDNPVGTILETPLPTLVERLGLAIANAQYALDRNSVEIARQLAETESAVQFPGDDRARTLLELGFAPTFYHLTEATIDAKVAFSIGRSESFGVSASAGVNLLFFAASVNASYSQKYSYDASASSAISARFVSIPPPTVFAELLRASVGKPPTVSNP
jgi:hypothetical protein